jgi:hypothetical protein
MNNIYELEINVLPGYLRTKNPTTIDVKIETYPAKFSIKEKNKLYYVYYSISELKLFCKKFNNIRDAKLYINKSMKLAMRGLYLFKVCPSCLEKIYFPETRCERVSCTYLPRFTFGIQGWDWLIETQIEKIPEHISNSKNELYQTNRFIYPGKYIEEPKELPDF